MAKLLYICGLLIASHFCFFTVECVCRTPDGKPGDCLSIIDCDPLLEMASKPERTTEEISLLQQSQCGFADGLPKVCCPVPCVTPDNVPGKCINIFDCPHLFNLLRTRAKAAIDYVQKSRCQGTAQYSVCCGPAPGDCRNTTYAQPPDPSSQCCGTESAVVNKIHGGDIAGIDQYPWLAIIEYRTRDSTLALLCGGVLISSKYVLTAGHCVAGRVLNSGTPVNVRLGEYNTTNEGRDSTMVDGGGYDYTDGALVVPIERTVPHPEYRPYSTRRWNDIAIIKLKQAAPYTNFIRPICLPNEDLTLTPPEQWTMQVAGWGAVSDHEPSSDVKRHVSVPFVDNNQCEAAYVGRFTKVTLGEKQLCAGGEAGKDSCRGDSGGPLMYKQGTTYQLLGIVSYGPRICGTEDVPGVYTKVYAYNQWIRDTIANLEG